MIKELEPISLYEDWEIINLMKSSEDRLLHDVDVVRHLETKEVRITLNPASPWHQELASKIGALSKEERDTVIALASNWYGSLLELIDAAKELTR
jgi:hypothetical protein